MTASGETHIVIISGANADLTPALVEANRAAIERSDMLLLQPEIPMESVLAAGRIALSAGVAVMLDPAPATELPEEVCACVSILTPDET